MTTKLSLSKLLEERRELQKDLVAFKRSFDVIRARIDESVNSPRQYPPLHKWSGSRAVVGSLEMAIQHLEQEITQYGAVINAIRSGEIEDADADGKPSFGVIEGGDHEL